MTVQPVQLSLTPEAGSAPTPAVAGSLPPSLLDTATEMLGRLMADAVAATTEGGSHE
jgi:hypothetical protein